MSRDLLNLQFHRFHEIQAKPMKSMAGGLIEYKMLAPPEGASSPPGIATACLGRKEGRGDAHTKGCQQDSCCPRPSLMMSCTAACHVAPPLSNNWWWGRSYMTDSSWPISSEGQAAFAGNQQQGAELLGPLGQSVGDPLLSACKMTAGPLILHMKSVGSCHKLGRPALMRCKVQTCNLYSF